MPKNLIIYLIFILALTGCLSNNSPSLPTVSPDFNYLIFLDNAPCPAPCWENLIIGKSKSNQALTEISKFSFVDLDKVRRTPQLVPNFSSESMVDGEVVSVSCANRLGTCITFIFANDNLREIYILLDSGVTMNQVVDRFGIPDYIHTHYTGGDETDCSVEVVWLSQQIVIYSAVIPESGNLYENCISVDETGIASKELEIAELRLLPLEEIKKSVIRRSLTEYIGIK